MARWNNGRDHAGHLEAEHQALELMANVSHELRTPLAIVKEGVSLLLEGIVGPVGERQEKVLVTTLRHIDRLMRLINDLLDVARLDAGRLTLRRSPVPLAGIIRQVAAAFETQARAKGLRVTVELPPDDVAVSADPDRLIQILTNLLANAVKFTARGGIEIAAQARDGHVECTVADTGCGIAPEDLPKIFEKFQQVGRPPGRGERGTGLGLAIVKQLVELHEGTIGVESALGKGTRFTFTLPSESGEPARWLGMASSGSARSAVP